MQNRCKIPLRPPTSAVFAVVKERIELKKFTLRERIEEVIMTLRTGERCPQPNSSGRTHAVDDRLDTILFGIDAPLFVDHRVAMKSCGNPLSLRRIGKQIAGDLLDGELIKRQVRV